MSRQTTYLKQNKLSKTLMRAALCALLGLSLGACSSLSMSDFGLGGSGDKKTASTQADKNSQSPNGPITLGSAQNKSASSVKKEEKGFLDRIGGWFGSDRNEKQITQKENNLAPDRVSETTAATNASLRAAQDITRLEPGNQQSTQPQQLAKTNQFNPPEATTPESVTTNSVNKTKAEVIGEAQKQATQPTKKEDGILDRIGGWFSSDSKKTSKKAVNGTKATNAPVLTSADADQGEALTPVQTLRLARKSQSTQLSSQGLTPYAPNITNQTSKPDSKIDRIADTTTKTNSIQGTQQLSQTKKTAQSLTKTKVSVRPLTKTKVSTRPTRTASISTTTEKTEYVVTPESYKAAKVSRAPAKQSPTANLNPTGKSDYLGAASPSPSAYKFYFGPGSTSLAPHHVAQLKGLAGQAIAQQKTISILGTSTPGGEAGSGTTQAGLQSLATARAMAAAQNLEKFGVPGNMIRIRIAQSTTPTDIGTGGNSSFQALSARRVEVKLQ